MRLVVPLLVLFLGGLARAHEPWEPIAGRNDTVRWTQAEAAGREVYRKTLCWHCHARFVRPLDDEHRRWGPVAWEAGTALPPDLQGGHRFGPDLSRPSWWRSRDWLYASLHDPRAVDPRAVMPRFPQLFDEPAWNRRREVEALIRTYDADGDGRVSFVLDARPSWREAGEDIARMAELDVAGLSAPPSAALQSKSGAELWYDSTGRRAYADAWRPGREEGDGVLSLRDVRPAPTQDARALVAYLQRVQRPPPAPAVHGTPWPVAHRGGFNGVNFGYLPGPEVAERKGRPAYARYCAHCHGADGRGDGPAGRYLDTPPTDLVQGRFKYAAHSNFALERVIRDGLPAAGMPGVPPGVVGPLTAFVLQLRGEKGTDRYWPKAPVMELESREDWDGYMQHVLRGKAVYVTLGCNTCHGTEGRGDGPDAVAQFADGRRVRARDFRPRDAQDRPAARLRAGAWPPRVYATIMDGLDTKGMPGARDIFYGKDARLGEDGLLSVPLKDPRIFYVGVRTHQEDGVYQEVLESLTRKGFGDDWKLVLYVLHMARTQEEVAQRKMAWPWIEVAK